MAEAKTLAEGKMRVEHMTVDKFDDGQRSALQQANMERQARGLPQWLIADFVRSHPGKFKAVDFELDHAEAEERNKTAELPAHRVDQRPVP